MDAISWRAAGVTLCGPSHDANGEPCQDAHSIVIDDRGYLIAIVSDGAGSTKSGGIAARRICDDLPPLILKALGTCGKTPVSDKRCATTIRHRVRSAVASVRSRLIALAADQDLPADELLATVVGVVAHPQLGGLFFQIGDGAAVAFGPDGSVLCLSEPENGEFVNTTYFLIEESWKLHLRLSFFQAPLGSVFLMTDGASELSLTRDKTGFSPFRQFFDPVGAYLSSVDREAGEAALFETLNSEAAREKVDDDKTIVWARVTGSSE